MPCCFNCLQAPRPRAALRGRTAGDRSRLPRSANSCRTEDPENLRCFNQKARYGIDFLYPVQTLRRRVHQRRIIRNRNGQAGQEPLFNDCRSRGTAGPQSAIQEQCLRGQGIVGVPWQDIAKDPSDL